MLPAIPLLAAALAACGGGPDVEPGKLDLAAVPHANAGCEMPSSEELVTGPTMLPGRVCMDCHQKDGEALTTFTAAGTVYGSPMGACNEPGLAGVLVEILDAEGDVQTSATTNEVGNFYTSAALTLPMRVRLSKDDKTAVMTSTQAIAACATCHQSEPQAGAPGRVYLE
jgi:cytochrome c553